jgi:hypothetical protein
VNLTPLQIIGIILAINGALTGATAQLTDLFGAVIAKDIVSVASLGSAILGGIITSMSGQAAQIRNVAAMPGVARVQIDATASQTVAQVALDPNQPKVGASTPDVRTTLQNIAKGS